MEPAAVSVQTQRWLFMGCCCVATQCHHARRFLHTQKDEPTHIQQEDSNEPNGQEHEVCLGVSECGQLHRGLMFTTVPAKHLKPTADNVGAPKDKKRMKGTTLGKDFSCELQKGKGAKLAKQTVPSNLCL